MTLVKSTGNKKVNLDFNKEFINTFSDKIKSGDIQFINQTLKDLTRRGGIHTLPLYL